MISLFIIFPSQEEPPSFQTIQIPDPRCMAQQYKEMHPEDYEDYPDEEEQTPHFFDRDFLKDTLTPQEIERARKQQEEHQIKEEAQTKHMYKELRKWLRSNFSQKERHDMHVFLEAQPPMARAEECIGVLSQKYILPKFGIRKSYDAYQFVHLGTYGEEEIFDCAEMLREKYFKIAKKRHKPDQYLWDLITRTYKCYSQYYGSSDIVQDVIVPTVRKVRWNFIRYRLLESALHHNIVEMANSKSLYKEFERLTPLFILMTQQPPRSYGVDASDDDLLSILSSHGFKGISYIGKNKKGKDKYMHIWSTPQNCIVRIKCDGKNPKPQFTIGFTYTNILENRRKVDDICNEVFKVTHYQNLWSLIPATMKRDLPMSYWWHLLPTENMSDFQRDAHFPLTYAGIPIAPDRNDLSLVYSNPFWQK